MAELQPLIVFGEGSQALYYQEKSPTLDKQGVNVLPILFSPSKELRDRYDITDDDLKFEMEDGRKALWASYPVKEVDWLNKSRGGSVMFIWCAPNRKSTPIMGKTNELLTFAKECNKKISRLYAYIATLNYDNENALSQQMEQAQKLKKIRDINAGERPEEEES